MCLVGLLVVASLAGAQQQRMNVNDVKAWFKSVKPLMQSRVPTFISGKSMTEEKYFDSLGYWLQLKYIAVFWQMRPAGLKEEWQNRIDFAMDNFGNLNMVPGCDVLIFGIPKMTVPVGDPSTCILRWGEGDQRIQFKYDHHLSAWNATMKNISSDRFHQSQLGDKDTEWHRAHGTNESPIAKQIAENAIKWAPTEEGWKLWADTIK